MVQTKRRTALTESGATNQAVAIYARVSTEDQAERATIQSQRDFLRRFVDLHDLPVAGEYVDDGISGTIPLADRPEGQRLLLDAEAGRFGVVLVYRIDRLGRSLLDAHDALSGCDVAIRSATELFDTTSPIGSFLFQLLASLAELEKSTIAERTSLGRNRVASAGGYTGGPIPLGYDLDEDNRLVASRRLVPEVGMTEAELIRDIFQRIASGESSLNGERHRLTALGVPRGRRYGGKDAPEKKIVAGWAISSLSGIVHNPIYKGDARVESSYGSVARPTEALIDVETWNRAQERLIRNRNLALKNSKNVYLLKGLIRCQQCGRAYVGTVNRGERRYRCNASSCRATGALAARCTAKTIGADWLEVAVWEECRRFVLNPGDALNEARAKLRQQMTKAAGFEKQRRDTLKHLAAKETERERVRTMYRRGRINDVEAERELDAIAREAAHLREILESERSRVALIDAQETFLTESAMLMARLRHELEAIEETHDLARKREVFECYVRQITIGTRDMGPRRKEADVRIHLRLKPAPVAVEIDTRSYSEGHAPSLGAKRLNSTTWDSSR